MRPRTLTCVTSPGSDYHTKLLLTLADQGKHKKLLNQKQFLWSNDEAKLMPLGALAEDSFRRVNEVFYSPAILLHIYVLYLAAAACSRERKIFFVPAKGTFSPWQRPLPDIVPQRIGWWQKCLSI